LASKQVSFYIDGFNLYYGRLKPNPALRWLDPDALARRLRPHDTVHVRYFTARVRAQPDPAARDRQRLYLRALDARPSISVHYGRFRTHPKFMALVNPLPGRPRIVEVHKTEEKGSDVNLATMLLVDGVDGLYDEAFVISNDGDLAEAIRQANTRFGPVRVLNPHHPANVNEIKQAAASYGPLDTADLAASQFPDTMMLPSGRTIHRPPTWTLGAAKNRVASPAPAVRRTSDGS
jgi:hypothetical protein